jgi:hypothetical protein
MSFHSAAEHKFVVDSKKQLTVDDIFNLLKDELKKNPYIPVFLKNEGFIEPILNIDLNKRLGICLFK